MYQNPIGGKVFQNPIGGKLYLHPISGKVYQNLIGGKVYLNPIAGLYFWGGERRISPGTEAVFAKIRRGLNPFLINSYIFLSIK